MFGFDRITKLSEQFTEGLNIINRLKGTTKSLLALAENRLALLAVEIEAEKLRLISLLLIGGSVLFFIGFGLLFGMLTLTLIFWDIHKEWVLGGFAVLFLIVGLFLLKWLLCLTKQPSALFSASIEELKKDQNAMSKDD